MGRGFADRHPGNIAGRESARELFPSARNFHGVSVLFYFVLSARQIARVSAFHTAGQSAGICGCGRAGRLLAFVQSIRRTAGRTARHGAGSRSSCFCRARSLARLDGDLSGTEIRSCLRRNSQKGRQRRIRESGLPRVRRSGLFCWLERAGPV